MTPIASDPAASDPAVSNHVLRTQVPQTPAKPRSGTRTAITVIVVFVIIAALGYGGWRWHSSAASASAGGSDDPTKAHAGGGGGRRDAGPAQVVTAVSREGNLPVYLDALGTVTALNTVTLRSRVDGELMQVLYTEGQVVKKDQVLAEIDPRPYQVQLTQAEGQLIKDQAELKNAKADLERYTTARETVSQQQIDTAEAAVAQYDGAIKIDQGAIDSANLNITYCHITSPLTGKIGLRTVDPGNIVHATDTTGMAVITQIQPIAVIFNLPESQLPSVLTAMKGDKTLGVDVLSSDRAVHLASGQLKAIDNQIDATTATVRIKGQFDNEDQMLYPNQFVNVRLKVQTLTNVVLVSSSALQRSPDSMFVYVVKSDNTIEMRPVTMGPAEASVTVIEKGLAPGETVVTDGVDKLAPGMTVVAHAAGASTQPNQMGSGRSTGSPDGQHQHRNHSPATQATE